MSNVDTAEKNGRSRVIEVGTAEKEARSGDVRQEPQEPVEPVDNHPVERELSTAYGIRDLLFFPDHEIKPSERYVLTIHPRDGERVLLGRVFFHRTLADNLIIERMAIGDRTIARGNGTAEIFHATIPNWTPQNLFLDKDNPLILVVRNPRHFAIRTLGSVVIFRKS